MVLRYLSLSLFILFLFYFLFCHQKTCRIIFQYNLWIFRWCSPEKIPLTFLSDLRSLSPAQGNKSHSYPCHSHPVLFTHYPFLQAISWLIIIIQTGFTFSRYNFQFFIDLRQFGKSLVGGYVSWELLDFSVWSKSNFFKLISNPLSKLSSYSIFFTCDLW